MKTCHKNWLSRSTSPTPRVLRAPGVLPGVAVAGLAVLALLGGCLERELKPLNPCLVSGVIAEIAVQNVDKVDLLFVVDNSTSMQEEQVLLRDQFPRLINTLTSGEKPDGSTFSPARDLHLAVVTTDMGLPRVGGVSNCEGFGDDGLMVNEPDRAGALTGCPSGTYNPPFLQYQMGVNEPMQVANEFACLASLGTQGCGYEQQLEAGLKALWPMTDIDPATGQQWVDPNTGQPSNRISFLGDGTGAGTTGHGDGFNATFLRNDPAQGLSLIAIVLVTDEEDCSSNTTDHFVPQNRLPEGSPYTGQGQNLRCYFNQDTNLYAVSRYVDGYQALRSEANKELVIFAAIAGVPRELVTPDRVEGILDDATARESFYEAILADPAMQEMIDPATTADMNIDTDNLVPSCRGEGGSSDDPNSKAYPPRRIVEVARGFGANGIVQSICQPDFTPAINAIIEIISRQLGAVCLPRELVRDASGVVGCNVIWELPLPGSGAPANTPTDCGQKGFLEVPGEGEAARTEAGNARCVVTQQPVIGNTAPTGSGWFYDDFTEETRQECPVENRQRIAFSDDAQPPTGVTVQLECLSEVQRVESDRDDINVAMYPDGEVPAIGTPCQNDMGAADDSLCVLATTSGTDSSMFCHPQQNVCVLECMSNADCPAAWVCDFRDANRQEPQIGGRAICVNPTCGTGD